MVADISHAVVHLESCVLVVCKPPIPLGSASLGNHSIMPKEQYILTWLTIDKYLIYNENNLVHLMVLKNQNLFASCVELVIIVQAP